MWRANGEAEYQSLGLTHDDISWLTDLQGAGGPRLVLAPSSRHATLQLNLSTADEALRALFGERAVHRALMLAIDREAINTLAYGGTWRARQFSPPEASPQYDAALAQAHIAYDPEEANRLLDEAGYAARDGEGYRRHPGGARVRIEIVGGAGEESASGQAAAAAADYLRAVGIDAAYRQITSEEYWRLHLAHNTLEAAWIEIDAPLLPLVHPTAFLGRGLSEAGHLPWAGLYAHHGLVAEGDPGAEPPPEGHFLWRLWQAGERLRTARSAAEQEAAWERSSPSGARRSPSSASSGRRPSPCWWRAGCADSPTGCHTTSGRAGSTSSGHSNSPGSTPTSTRGYRDAAGLCPHEAGRAAAPPSASALRGARRGRGGADRALLRTPVRHPFRQQFQIWRRRSPIAGQEWSAADSLPLCFRPLLVAVFCGVIA